MSRYHIGTLKCTGCTKWVSGHTPSGDYTNYTDDKGRCQSCIRYDKPVRYDNKGRILPE